MQSWGADSETASKTAAAWCDTWAISPSRLVSPATTPRWCSHAAPRSPAGISAPCRAGVLAYVELNRCGREIHRELGWESCLPDDLLAAFCECDLILSSSAFWLDFSGVKPAEVWGFTDAVGLEVIAGWVESSSLCLLAPSSTLQLRQISDVRGALHFPCMLLVGDSYLCCQTAAAGRTVGLNSSLYTAFCPCNSTGLWSYAWQMRCHTVSSYLGASWNWTKLTWS